MSRIHEALQKASDQGGTDPASTTPESGSANGETGSDETYPIELSERRRVRAQAAAATPVAPPKPSMPEAATQSTPEEELRLAFERIDARYAGKIVVDQDISAESREQYRRLAASLHHAQAATGIKVIMLTSAVMSEGKTLTSSNLALTLSESYKKQVLLIDADLRRPSLHALFRIQAGSGLTEGLKDGAEHKIPVHQISSRLSILAAGRPTSDPIAGLTSLRMKKIVEEARGAFDWVIVDTPPVALLPDANLLGAIMDGAIIVVRAGSTSFDLVQKAAAAIGHERLLGVVLNGATEESAADYYGYNYYSVPQATTGQT
jgi:capsular exopolysaccharide synthesis family protein